MVDQANRPVAMDAGTQQLLHLLGIAYTRVSVCVQANKHLKHPSCSVNAAW